MGEHSTLFSPSSYKYDKICPARVILSLPLAPEEPNEKAVRGSAMHDVADDILKINLKQSLSTTQKKSRVKKLLATLLDDNEREMVEKHVEWTLSLRQKVLKQVSGKYVEHFEGKLSDSEDSFGTVDYGLVIISNKVHILIVDFKSGDIDVEAEYNEQMMRYLLMIIFGDVPDDKEIGSVHLCINQPSTTDKSKVWKVPIEYIAEFRKEFADHKKQIYRMLNEGVEDSDFNVTEHCGYCPAIAVCPKQLEQKEKLLEAPMGDTTKFDLDKIDVQTIPFEKKIKIMEATPVVKKFLEAIAKSVVYDMQNGQKSDDYKLVESNTKRGWRKDKKVSELAKELRSLGCTSVTESKLIGIGKIEAQLKKKNGMKPKEIYEVMKDFTVKPVGYPTIAPMSDKREPLLTNKESIQKHLTINKEDGESEN